ncbi:hypothetical protein AB205_0047420 [Aquarana catesbeiana]|uniref:Uncharacterized protein n=1 Tax=Aquarana catesbeiana TaxID=8400 RepID=A0A2G9SME0_AQUCT|nr:hypothetical protein AB205_0047420 [Aquarana catesbeiana]
MSGMNEWNTFIALHGGMLTFLHAFFCLQHKTHHRMGNTVLKQESLILNTNQEKLGPCFLTCIGVTCLESFMYNVILQINI